MKTILDRMKLDLLVHFQTPIVQPFAGSEIDLLIVGSVDQVPARIQSRAFTFVRSLLLPNALICEPFFLPSPPAS
jgi:hypothetical protein